MSLTLGQDKAPRNDAWPPTEPLEAHARSKARLGVKAADRLFGRSDLALDLDHEGRPAAPLDREDVDRAALAIDLVRHLHGDLPPGRPEHRHDLLDQLGVPLVKEPIQRSSSPAHDPLKRSVDGREGASKGLHR